MLDPKEYERLQRRFRSLSDETLLDMLKNQRHSFRPEALQLIRDELKLRGYHDEDLAIPENQPDDEPARFNNVNLIPVAKCPDGFIAGQVMDLLLQNGIYSVVLEENAPDVKILSFRAPLPDRGMTIAVASHEAERAKEILADFPPLMEETASNPDSPDESEK